MLDNIMNIYSVIAIVLILLLVYNYISSLYIKRLRKKILENHVREMVDLNGGKRRLHHKK